MSEARIVVAVAESVAAAATSASEMAVAATITRSAPPVPVLLSWQPAPAQVFVEVTPFCVMVSCLRKIGKMHFWKYGNASVAPPVVDGLETLPGLLRGSPPPPQPASRAPATAAGRMPA